MTCGPVPTTFRILARDASWELDLTPDAGAVLGDAIELALREPASVDPDALAAVMPPAWIARDGGACAWYVVSPPPCAPPALRRFDPCAGSLAGIACHVALVNPVAVAVTRGLVAVLDPGRGELLVVSPGGERVITAIPCRAPGPIAFFRRSIIVADGRALAAYDLVGSVRRELATAPGTIARLAVAQGVVWAAIDTAGALTLVRLGAAGWEPAPLAELVAAAPATGIAALGPDTACLPSSRGGSVCFDRCGRPAPPPPPPPPRDRWFRTGTVVASAPIDSGIPRCSWHRVRIELELPEGTGVEIALATTDDPTSPIASEDWQVVDAGEITSTPGYGPAQPSTCDYLIDQPPGRYLALRLVLHGDGTTTPRIRRIRLDFPRSTSALRLPGVYREDPVATDFLERFVAMFDAAIEDLDRAIECFPALIDPAAAPAEALAWLGTFLDIALDPAWSEATRRAILGEAPTLYRQRGTPRALARAIELAIGVTPAIQELGGGLRPFGRLGAGRVGEVRLFGRARARVRLGASVLGAAPLHSYGDPDRDHVAALGWRIVVQVPGGEHATPEALARLRRLVDAQKPAHVAASVRVGADVGLLGIDNAVGVDTRLGGLPVSYLGTNTRLGRRTVLARGPVRGGAGFAVGTASAIAIQTVLS